MLHTARKALLMVAHGGQMQRTSVKTPRGHRSGTRKLDPECASGNTSQREPRETRRRRLSGPCRRVPGPRCWVGIGSCSELQLVADASRKTCKGVRRKLHPARGMPRQPHGAGQHPTDRSRDRKFVGAAGSVPCRSRCLPGPHAGGPKEAPSTGSAPEGALSCSGRLSSRILHPGKRIRAAAPAPDSWVVQLETCFNHSEFRFHPN